MDSNSAALFMCQVFEVRKALFRPGVIDDVKSEHGPAAVELKIEVSTVFFRLNEKFHTAVLVNGLLKSGMNRADIIVVDTEKPM